MTFSFKSKCKMFAMFSSETKENIFNLNSPLPILPARDGKN